MNPERLHDAISLLPEELLTPVDTLRQKRKVPWKSVAAAVACLCLAVGLWLIQPGYKLATDSANGSALPEMESPKEEIQHSTANDGFLVQVLTVAEDHVLVLDPPKESADGNSCIQMATITMTFENLSQVPTLQPGQSIRIYFEDDQFDVDNSLVKPYKIEIIKEEEQ